jgi:hypothetical protein
VLVQGIDQPVAPPPVDEPGSADLPVVLAGGDELGEGELAEAAGVAVREGLHGDDVVDERGGKGEPAEPQAGSKGLTCRAGVGDPLRGEGLDGADWLAVVAELAVVVVFDDQPGGGVGPGDDTAAPVRRKRRAERELMCRGQEHGGGVGELVDHGPVAVDRDGNGGQPGGGGDVTVPRLTVNLHGQCPGAAAAQCLADQPEPLGEAGADDDAVGVS